MTSPSHQPSFWKSKAFACGFVVLGALCATLLVVPQNELDRFNPFIEPARRQHPNSGVLRALLSQTSSRSGANRQANIARLQNAIRSSGPNDPFAGKAFYQIASHQYSLGQHQAALKSLAACLKLPESHPDLHYSARHLRMNVLISLGRKPEALHEAIVVAKMPGTGPARASLVMNAMQWKQALQRELASAAKQNASSDKIS